MPTDTGFGDYQKNSEKFQKIMKNLEYQKTMFETEIGQIGLPEMSIRAIYQDRAPGSDQG